MLQDCSKNAGFRFRFHSLKTPLLRVLASAWLGLAPTGCDFGQAGKFRVDGGRAKPLSSCAGVVEIIDASDTSRRDGSTESILYILIFFPDVPGKWTSSRERNDRYVTTLTHEWDTHIGPLSVEVEWNRKNDRVRVGQFSFARTNGNVLVIRGESDGRLVPQQLPSLPKHSDFAAVLRHAQEQLKDDKAVRALTLE